MAEKYLGKLVKVIKLETQGEPYGLEYHYSHDRYGNVQVDPRLTFFKAAKKSKKAPPTSPKMPDHKPSIKTEHKLKHDYVQIYVGKDISEDEEFKALRKEYQGMNIKLSPRVSKQSLAYISDKRNSQSEEAQMRGLLWYKSKVLNKISGVDDAIGLRDEHPDLQPYFMHPLTKLTFFLDDKSMDEELMAGIREIIQENGGQITHEREEADITLHDPKKDSNKQAISYQMVYHFVGGFRQPRKSQMSANFTQTYINSAQLIDAVQYRIEHCPNYLLRFAEGLALTGKRVLVQLMEAQHSSPMQRMLSLVSDVVGYMQYEKVMVQDNAEVVFTGSMKDSKRARDRARSRECLYLSPAWVFDSIFSGKCLNFFDYLMVDLTQREHSNKSETRELSQKSILYQEHQEEKQKEQERKNTVIPQFFIHLENEQEQEEAETKIEKLKGEVVVSKAKGRFVIAKHGNIQDTYYKWQITPHLEDVKYLTPQYLDACLEEGHWIPPKGSNFSHNRSIPCKLPVENADNVLVYITGDGGPGTKESLYQVMGILGVPNTKKMKEQVDDEVSATHLIPLNVTDKLAKAVGRIEQGMQAPTLVSVEWLEHIANKGKVPADDEEFPIPKQFVERARQASHQV